MKRKMLEIYSSGLYAERYYLTSRQQSLFQSLFEGLINELSITREKKLYLLSNNLVQIGYLTEGYRYAPLCYEIK